MFKKVLAAAGLVATIAIILAASSAFTLHRGIPLNAADSGALEVAAQRVTNDLGFTVEVLIGATPAEEYAARGRTYIEALENAEYQIRIHNPTGARVAVALSVDGLNSIDARHTSAWEAHKWVIGPYGTIHVRGWQMSSENARRFYFTTERDSYAARLGQPANLGVISAVFFRERQPITVMPVTPAPRPDYEKDERVGPPKTGTQDAPSTSGAATRDEAKQRSAYPPPDDESAATGIGRTVANGVQWVKMDLEPRPVGEVTIRYEYRAALVKLGIVPRDYPNLKVLDRREKAKGFEPRYCPEPQP